MIEHDQCSLELTAELSYFILVMRLTIFVLVDHRETTRLFEHLLPVLLRIALLSVKDLVFGFQATMAVDEGGFMEGFGTIKIHPIDSPFLVSLHVFFGVPPS